jgi:arsenate reductase-like glutaredoxin family protein
MAVHPPTKEELIELVPSEPNLIRRPVLRAGSRVVIGFDKDALRRCWEEV